MAVPRATSSSARAIAEHLGATRGMRAAPEQIIITAGAQEGINLICRLLIEPGVRVAVENPCYGGAARTFRQLTVRHLSPLKSTMTDLMLLRSSTKRRYLLTLHRRTSFRRASRSHSSGVAVY